jgi:hypothetical protein
VKKELTELVNTLGPLWPRAEDMVSFYVILLFTTVPVEVLSFLLTHHFEEDIMAVFCHVLASIYFSFMGQFYMQTDGEPMRLLFSSMTTTFCVEDFREQGLDEATDRLLC